jgi:hypothetical protein
MHVFYSIDLSSFLGWGGWVATISVRAIMSQPLDTPEQIAAYIQARKKSYPTATNVLKKVCRSILSSELNDDPNAFA